MANTVDILIAVDALGAASSGNLSDNVYMIDTNKHVGSGNEGKNELYTSCVDGQILKWRVVGISPSSDVSIHSFTGQMIKDGICNPRKQDAIPSDIYWEGMVESRGTTGNIQYSIVISIDGRQMSFDPFLKITNA